MMSDWSFGKKLGAGFSLGVFLTVLVALIGIRALNTVTEAKDRVIEVDAHVLIEVQKLETLSEQRVAANRGFLLTGEAQYVEQFAAFTFELNQALSALAKKAPNAAKELEAVARESEAYKTASEELAQLRKTISPEALEAKFTTQLRPIRRAVTGAIDALMAKQEASLAASANAASETRNQAISQLVGVSIIASLMAAFVAFLLTRGLSRQIGSAVSLVQSSSTELQAAATQQASGSKEQATAITEITTTISELLATSRQIAESAQRVSRMAQQTAESARAGTETVSLTREAVLSIQRQVQQVVTHMLELAKKSQQIGTVLDIVSELAEQTNILAINATIEASGAGEAGRRFAVVADEVRKLADRVGGSAKEIRELIDEVRSAVNTTIMATETGSKAADSGTKQFADVTSAFERITSLVSTTTEASREIELSTKQQATAVEQVNTAIGSAAQATKETEASSMQTLQTASQLASLSKQLLHVVQPQTAG
jgi:methyl-accepting chemotaxis protein